MSIERKKDEKGNLIFGVGSIDFSNQGEAEIKINELEEEKAKKKKAEKTDLMKEVARSTKEKAETNNETNEETKNNGRNHWF